MVLGTTNGTTKKKSHHGSGSHKRLSFGVQSVQISDNVLQSSSKIKYSID